MLTGSQAGLEVSLFEYLTVTRYGLLDGQDVSLKLYVSDIFGRLHCRTALSMVVCFRLLVVHVSFYGHQCFCFQN